MEKLAIHVADNGYLLVHTYPDVGMPQEEWAIEQGEDESDARVTQRLLREVMELLGLYGSRHDSERVYVEVRPGDKYLATKEWLEGDASN